MNAFGKNYSDNIIIDKKNYSYTLKNYNFFNHCELPNNSHQLFNMS